MTPGESAHNYNVTMIAPDRRGLLSKAAGVLALNSLRVHSAAINSASGAAINTFVVSPHFGSPPAAELPTATDPAKRTWALAGRVMVASLPRVAVVEPFAAKVPAMAP